MHNFKQKIIPNSSTTLEVQLLSDIKNINVDDFLKSYKISNMWKGKFFIKRIIKKIFKYQLITNINWNNNFWQLITINLISTNLQLDTDDITLQLKNKITKKRFNDIEKYKKILIKKDMGSPLYITGKALNIIGGNAKNNEIFILDGSRRIIASALSNLNPNILLIDSLDRAIE
ncbi:MAG: hypothetical protein CMG50_05125 [Candidatus Marinimicrobia bacterium]|nr:hypothetical protein [Candidatus Neomarinimicrobiota bacterium]|tara:strand:+ start:118 stop:639 length:522 start_codon:yes stop_codon:yes gene_type:complete